MDDNSLWGLRGRGQGVWLCGLRRLLTEADSLAGLAVSYGISGIETDLLMLAGAVERGPEYHDSLVSWANGVSVARPVEALLIEEASIGARLLAPVYEETEGRDGYVSVDVDPSLANDVEEMSMAIRRLHSAIDEPNVIPRLPPTKSGCAVFEAFTAEGFSVHVGPIFSVASAERVTEAFARGALRLPKEIEKARRLASVVSFGLASLDEAIDELLKGWIRTADRDVSGAESLLGSVATAIAKVACRHQRDLLFQKLPGSLRESGPRSLRLMWTDLATGDPRRHRLRYIHRLIGPDTIAAMPLGLMRDCACAPLAESALGQRVDEAEEILEEVESLGIDLDAIGSELQERYIARRRLQYGELGNVILAATEDNVGGKRQADEVAGIVAPLSTSELEVPSALIEAKNIDDQLPTRLWLKDSSLWSEDPTAQDFIRNRLGWLDLVESTPSASASSREFVKRMDDGDVDQVILLGMGGSSLCAEVCRQVFAVEDVWIVDSTIPTTVAAVAASVDLGRTLVIVASKSGTTIELQALLDFFHARCTRMFDRPGQRFVAITDPGTPLEQIAYERGFRSLWLAPTDVGGRFSALSVFGILPMELMAIDSVAVWTSARRMAASCAAGTSTPDNPGTRLGAALFNAYEAGRDKVTFVCSPSLTAFGMWAEQLIAESTGKEGVGLVPIVGEPVGEADQYGDDRIFVALELAGEDDSGRDIWLDALRQEGHPVMKFVLDNRYQIGAEFIRWQIAVASAGFLMGINPFDQPDVQGSKNRTKAILDSYKAGTGMPDRAPIAMGSGWVVFADLERDKELASQQNGDGLESWLSAHLGRAQVPDYVALQAFVACEPRTLSAFQEIRRLLCERRGVATTLGWGPAFLHSTGQLHKGGPDNGIFLQITADDSEDIEIPGAGYSFGRLVRAQSLGDLAALEERGRRVLRVHLRDVASGAEALLEAADRGLA